MQEFYWGIVLGATPVEGKGKKGIVRGSICAVKQYPWSLANPMESSEA